MIQKSTQPSDKQFAFAISIMISVMLNFILVLLFFYGKEMGGHPDRPEMRPLFSYQHIIFGLITNFLMAYILYLWNFRLMKTPMKSHHTKLWVIIVSTILLTLLLSYVFSLIHHEVIGPGGERKPLHFLRGGFFQNILIAVIVLFSSQLLYMWRQQQQTIVENQKLLAENMQTRYQALKNQVDPHFLFNSLNTLNSLIKTNPEKAEEYVHQLSFVFRYTLQQKTIITVREELEFTKAYCHLMNIRYGDSLSFDFQIDTRYDDYNIIPLSLQILVENAIKHNVISAKQPLRIAIKSGDDETITVSNPVQLKKEPETGAKIGLANLSDRYLLMAHREIFIEKTDSVFSVQVPLIRQVEE